MGGTAQRMADEAAQEAVVARLAPICIEQYNRDPEKDQKLKTMKEIDVSWNRRNYVRNQAWATMPGEKDPDIEVAVKCADMLMQLGQ